MFLLDGIWIMPASSSTDEVATDSAFPPHSPPLCLPLYSLSHPLYAGTWKQQGRKKTAINLTREQHIALLSKPPPCTHEAIIKKTTEPMKKNNKASQFSVSTSPSSCSLLHSSAKGIPWWLAISESSSAWSYSKLMNWKMNRCRQRERCLDPSWRWNSRPLAADTQVFQAQVYIFCTDVGGL